MSIVTDRLVPHVLYPIVIGRVDQNLCSSGIVLVYMSAHGFIPTGNRPGNGGAVATNSKWPDHSGQLLQLLPQFQTTFVSHRQG